MRNEEMVEMEGFVLLSFKQISVSFYDLLFFRCVDKTLKVIKCF